MRKRASFNLSPSSYSTSALPSSSSSMSSNNAMFEVPSLAAADFELTALSTFHPISLKSRFRNAFKGFKHEGREPSTRGKCNEKRSTTTLIHNRSESDIEQSNGADYAHKTSCPSSISTCCAAVSPSRTPAQNACTSLFSFDSSNNDSSSNDLLNDLKSDMTLDTSDKNSCVANAKLPKDLIVALQFFNEMMRTDKTEMLLGSLEAIFDASIAFLSKLKHQAPLIQNALVALLDWAENKLEDCEAEQLKTMKREGVRLAADLQKRIAEHNNNNDAACCVPPRPSPKARTRCSSLLSSTPPKSSPTRLSPPQRPNFYQQHQKRSSLSSQSNDSGVSSEFSYDKSPSQVHSSSAFQRPENCSNEHQQQSIDDLLRQLNLRQVENFEPIFLTVDNDESDEDDSSAITIDEHREEREEKKDRKTCEEEVQRLADGSEIRMKKTRTINLQRRDKHVTIRTHGGGRDEDVKRFEDSDLKMNDEVDMEDFFRARTVDRHHDDDDVFMSSALPLREDATSQRIRTVQHSDAVTQSVAKTAKRNGKIISANAAHKIDTTELNAKQIETFKGETLLDRQGKGSYEELSIVKHGLPSASGSPPPIPPKRKHVVQYMQTFGDKNDGEKDDFFKGSTLASYILLNDNLRYHEEQYRKKISVEFSRSGGNQMFLSQPSASTFDVPYEWYIREIAFGASVPSQDFSILSQLLQYSDHDQIRLPTRYTDEVEEEQRAITYPQYLPVTASPGVLESLDVSEWLVLRAKDAYSKPNEVRGGPKDALIAYATQQAGSLLYQEAFLTTYRTIASSLELFQKLVRRYVYMCRGEDHASIKSARQTFSVIVRVVDELCAVELKRELLRAVTSFIYRLIRDGNYTFARILRKRLMYRIEHKSVIRRSIWDEVLVGGAGNKVLKASTLFEFRSSLVAKQMTYLDADLFQKIEPAEMLWWAEEQDEKKSPNLCAFTEHFNKVSYWVRTLVIQPSEQRLREKYLMKFVKIMKQLRTMGNYNSYLAILSALDSGPIRRLDWTRNVMEMLKEHSTIMDSSHSFKNYRTLLAESRPPCLPYIGLVLQDLTFVHVGNSDMLPAEHCEGRRNLLNFGKRWQQFAILDSVRRFKSWNYSIERDDRVLQFFDGFKNYLSEDDIWEMSETIKPRTRKLK